MIHDLYSLIDELYIIVLSITIYFKSSKMKSSKIVLSIVFLAFTFLTFAQKTEQITIETLLQDMVDREAIASFPKTNFRLKQESSYNRASKTPTDYVGWFNNQDYNKKDKEDDHNFIRTEEKNGQKMYGRYLP